MLNIFFQLILIKKKYLSTNLKQLIGKKVMMATVSEQVAFTVYSIFSIQYSTVQ